VKAVWLGRPGSADVLEIVDVDKPAPKDNEVLVRIHTATVTRGDVALRRMPRVVWPLLRLGTGLRRMRILGHEFAGTIEAVGRNVTSFKAGEIVLGTTTGLEFGSHAEYVCVPGDGRLVVKPPSATFGEAAALPTGAMTALWLLRKARIEAGMSVLVYGASGSVGTAAVQLAAHLGAVVTAVCSTANVDLVRSLGASRVIDYLRDTEVDAGETYDIMVDAVGKMPRSRRRTLKRGGALVSVTTTTTRERPEDLAYLRDLLARRAIRPVIDRSFRLEEIREAHRYVEAGHKRGNVILSIDLQ
jgi:NADPH:quinone reductase-like Zn-dependent oxidoreductase